MTEHPASAPSRWPMATPMAFVATAALIVSVFQTTRKQPTLEHVSQPSGFSTAKANSSTATPAEEQGRENIETTLPEVIAMAETALEHLITNVDDYTATLIKEEKDRNGVLQSANTIEMKVATRHVGGKSGSPLKVYLKFVAPNAVKGREVIWVENENDNKLSVREAGILGAMMTASLAPDGMLAMRGQRYPIWQIGLTNLIEQLIERGGEDIGDPNVSVTLESDFPYDGMRLTRIVLRRSSPSGKDNDFSSAEVIVDQKRQLVLKFCSYDWPDAPEDSPEVIESYSYQNVKLNVGLTDLDFDTENPEYTFP
ncbi:MAG: DUF1571 domain-containing protein [Planctomycetota bacterium]